MHLANANAKVEVDFDCAVCGFAGTAEVKAEGGETIAGEDESARHHGELTVSVMHCPRCQRRSRLAIARFFGVPAIGIAMLLALLPLVWWFVTGLDRWLVGGTIVVTAVAVVVDRRRHFVFAQALVDNVRVRANLPRAVVVARAPKQLSAGPPAPPPVTPAPPAPADGGDPPPDVPRLLR